MTRRQELIEEFAQRYVGNYSYVSRSMVHGFVDLAFTFKYVSDQHPGILEYSRPHFECALVRRIEELLEEREEEKRKKRPVLVYALTGERMEGPEGMSEDNYFGMLFS